MILPDLWMMVEFYYTQSLQLLVEPGDIYWRQTFSSQPYQSYDNVGIGVWVGGWKHERMNI